ncbi:MAG: sigma-70 family RNA polymerase sigma factor [Actinobacteria bacterium]|nr:sigma-70 family RNA polymerase sigma factor [Actinomycetota bacterium]MCA1721163.1 sigma-70 family RNA polymerase sigma factor [Actinomycetota bacterium]
MASLYAASAGRLTGLLTLMGGDRAEAEDAVQDAFAALLPRWDHVRRYDDPEAWLRQVAVRRLLNRKRHLGRRQRILGAAPRAELVPEPGADRVDLEAALWALPPQQRAAVVLHHVLGLPVDAVAAELHVAVGTVKSRLSRGRASLAAHLRVEAEHDA